MKSFSSALGYEAGQSVSVTGRGGVWNSLSRKVQVSLGKRIGCSWRGAKG